MDVKVIILLQLKLLL